jgi:hypothetical protein
LLSEWRLASSLHGTEVKALRGKNIRDALWMPSGVAMNAHIAQYAGGGPDLTARHQNCFFTKRNFEMGWPHPIKV